MVQKRLLRQFMHVRRCAISNSRKSDFQKPLLTFKRAFLPLFICQLLHASTLPATIWQINRSGGASAYLWDLTFKTVPTTARLFVGSRLTHENWQKNTVSLWRVEKVRSLLTGSNNLMLGWWLIIKYCSQIIEQIHCSIFNFTPLFRSFPCKKSQKLQNTKC